MATNNTATAVDYGEIFCTAVDNILQQRMSELTFDMSKECTIIRINDKPNGKYQVSDGSMSFEAQAGIGDYYDVGDQVIVTIPQGDYNKQISILNKIVDDWSGPGGFVRPLDTIIQCTDNVAINVNPTSLTANKNPNKISELDSNASSVQILNLSNKMFYGFSRVAVVAEFKTLLNNLNIVTGDYGLIFDLIENNTEIDDNGNVQRNTPKKVLTYQFSCNDMLGNPYEFSTFFQQEYAFDIPVNFTVHDIKVYFYQNGQFKDGNNTLIAVSEYANLFVQNLQIYFGYARDIEIKDSIELTSDYLSYNNLGENWRYLYLQWFHKIGENNLKQITSADTEATNSAYSVRWYRHKTGVEGDNYGGSNWEHINSTAPTWVINKDTEEPYTDYPFVMKWDMDENLIQEKFKVVALVKTHPLSNDPTYEVVERYESNTLVFENVSENSGGGENAEDTIRDNLTLHFHDGSYGNYFIYDQNGLLINSAEQGQSNNRVIELMYYGEPINKSSSLYPDIASIEWGVPEQGKYSMIMYNLEQTNGTFSNPKDELLDDNKWKYIYREFGDSDSQWSEPQPLVDKKFSIIDGNKFREIYAIQTFQCSNNGSFSFTGGLKLFNDKSPNKDLAEKLDTVLSFMVWTSTDGESWYEASTQPIQKIATYKGGGEYTFDHNFNLNRPHTYMRVGIGFREQFRDNWPSYKKSGETEYTALTTTELGQIDWNIEITEQPSFKSKSVLYTNTSYPGENKTLNTSFNYSILNSYTQERNNNTIRCIVNLKNGKRCELTETLRFGPKGSSGTSNTFILEILENKNALVYDDDDNPESKELKIEAVLINNTGKKVYFDATEAKKIKWKLLNNTNSLIQLDGSYNDIVTEKEESNVLLKYVNSDKENEQTLLQENYVILQASYEYYKADKASKTKPILHAFLPIPIRSKNCYGKSGPNQIIYNHLGVPSYGENPYIAYSRTDGNENEHRIWQLKQDENNPNHVYFKIVKESNEEEADPFECSLVPSPLYSSIKDNEDPIQDKVCVYCLEDNIILWSQPILIMQSNYDFAMLNAWDGSLTIDEEGGTILATMLGAGRKNSQNQFSGVLIGDIKGGTGLLSTDDMTGVYGFENGVMTYGLRDNGSAFFGAQHGRIEIDGTSGIIRSAGWYNDGTSWKLNTTDDNKKDIDGLSILKKSTGTLLDLDDGMLLMNGGNNSYFKFNEDNKGTLEMSLSGLNLKLTDKTNNPNLSSYIDLTAKKLVTEFRRTAIYAVNCSTADGTATKKLNLKDFTKADFFNSDNASEDNKVSDLGINDIQKDGVTIAVTFTNAETVTSEKIDIKDGDTVTGHKYKYTGKALFIQIDSNTKKPIYINGAATNATPSLNEDGEVNSSSNSFGWTAGSIIYLTYKTDHWEVSDSGSYSRITQTADMIRSEVSDIGGNLSSTITQTKHAIETEVKRTGGYSATCSTGASTSIKAVNLSQNCLFEDKNIFYSGVTIAVTFTNANSAGLIYLNIVGTDLDKHGSNNGLPVYINNKITANDNKVEWNAGSTIYFSFIRDNDNATDFGHWNVVDSGSYSKITQTADEINSSIFGENGLKSSLTQTIEGFRTEVFGKNGLSSEVRQNATDISNKVSNEQTGQSFNWSLKSDGFYMNANADATKDSYVFKCDADGLTLNGNGIIKSGNYSEENKKGMLINLNDGLINAANFTLNSSQVQISAAGIYFRSSDFSEGSSNSETVLFYYREGIPAWGSSTAIWVHTATDKSVASMYGNTSYRVQIECDSAGNPIITSENGYGQPCYKIRNLQINNSGRLEPIIEQNGFNNSTYYISRYWDNKDSFNIQSGINSVKIGSNQKYINGVLFDLANGIIKIGSGSKWISITADGIKTSG